MALVAEMLSYPFMVRAFIVGTLVALCAALLGVSLVLRRFSMIGDGLSHVGFGAMAVATAVNAAPLAVAIPVVVASAFLLLRVSDGSKIKGDASIALISTGALAVGVFVISMSTGMNTDVDNYLFGSILGLSQTDVVLSIIVSVAVLIVFVILYNRIVAITFDESFAKATGTNTGAYNAALATLAALVIVLGMKLMGALLISSLIVFPALTSMRVHDSFRRVTISSAVVSVACLWIGITVSYVFSTPAGASVVLCNIAAFFLHWAVGAILRRAPKGSQR